MYRLLIVDDEPKIRSGLRLSYPWKSLGFEIVGEASNGSDALDYVASHNIDAILADIRMPVMSGIEMSRKLDDQKSIIKVVLLSGYKEFEYARKAIKYGVFSYLVKPTEYCDVISTFGRLRETLDRENQGVSGGTSEENLNEGLYAKMVNDVYSYVEDNLAHASLEGAAYNVGRSIYYLSRLFKEQTDENFSDYVMRKRMERAALLLSSYRYDIGEISNLIGYNSPKSFTKAFKAYFGKTPRDYRKDPQSSKVNQL